MKTAKPKVVAERYIDDRWVDVAELRYYVDTKGAKRHTVILEFFDKVGVDVRMFKFQDVEGARACWRTLRQSMAQRGLDRV